MIKRVLLACVFALSIGVPASAGAIPVLVGGGDWQDNAPAKGSPMTPKALAVTASSWYLSQVPVVGQQRIGRVDLGTGLVHTLTSNVNAARGIAVGPDGTVYVANTGGFVIFKIAPNGVQTTLAGIGTQGYSGDGGLALNAAISAVYGIAYFDDGVGHIDLIFADFNNERIRAIRLSDNPPTIRSLATTGNDFPSAVTCSADGTVYYSGLASHKVKKIALDGTVTTVAGTTAGYSGDKGPAILAQMNQPFWMVQLNGILFIGEIANMRIRTVNLATGIIDTLLNPVVLSSMAIVPGGLYYGGDGSTPNSVWFLPLSLVVPDTPTPTRVATATSLPTLTAVPTSTTIPTFTTIPTATTIPPTNTPTLLPICGPAPSPTAPCRPAP